MKNVKYYIAILFVATISGCIQDFPYDENWSNSKFDLINQDSAEVSFPDIIEGKIGVVGFIYTNCPDICPLTTNNMRIIKEGLEKEGINDVSFVTITFDPDFDTPSVLKKYAELRNLDLSNWQFLTGEKKTIKRLLKAAGIVAAVGDSTVFNDKSKIYYYVHTDRIALFDQNGHLRKNYFGSTLNTKEVIEDIKKLESK